MGLIGIVLVIGCIAIAGYMIMDTYLGAPPKPRVLLTVIAIGVLGGLMIFVDYKTQPQIIHAEFTTDEVEYFTKNKMNKVTSPIKLRLKRDIYPWYSIFNRNRTDIIILPEQTKKQCEKEEK
jgi:hypothetical protein